METNVGKRSYKKMVFVVAIIALVIFGIWLFGDILSLLAVYPWITDKFVQIGLNIWLARALGIGFYLILLAYVIPLIFSLKKTNRRLGYLKLSGIMMGFMLVMYAANRDRNFDNNGENLKCYTRTPYGSIELSACSDSVHPIYGTKVEKMTKEIAAEMFRDKNTLPITNRITPTLNTRLFSPDGTPLVYYYQHPGGKIELFNQPGHHPTLAVSLSPLTPATAQILNSYLRERNYDMIITDGTARGNSSIQGDSPLKDLSSYLKEMKGENK
ncbi:MAG: hypothetical protein Q7T50_00500 [Candidatus Magasanikbacteria bacterium]|nr:hypothetical protein [Candidatus Magasanikbacteria bacterium]